jgi:hypothetical protein
MSGSRIRLENVQRSRQIAAIIPTVRDNLPAQRKIIELCRQVLGGGFKVHVPRLGAPGSLSLLQLKTFAKLPHTVYTFSLGRVRDVWLWLEEESRRYLFRYHTWCIAKGGQRYIDEDILRERIQ